MLKRWASQALSPVTLMITLLLSSLKSSAKVQLIIDIDKEKGIFFATTRPSLPKEGTYPSPNLIPTWGEA